MLVDKLHGIHHITRRLAHFAIAHQPPAVCKNGLGQFHPHGLKHDRPVHRMGGEDVLPDQVTGRRPPGLEFRVITEIPHRADVIGQGIAPDISHKILIERQLNSPAQAALGPRHTQVIQFLPQEPERLIAPEIWLDKFRIVLNVLDQPVLILAHPQEIVGLADPVHRPFAVRTGPVLKVFLHEKPLTGDTIPTVILGPVDLALLIQRLKQLLHHSLMPGLGGTDEIIVGDFELLPQVLKTNHRGIGMLLGRDSRFIRRLLNLLSMLIRAGQKKGRHV